MSGEYINSNNIEDYWKQLKNIYQERSIKWQDLTAEQYQAIQRSEREDSDNHFNQERLGKETSVIDICHYKSLPDRQVAYHIEIIHQDKTKKDFFFQIKLKEGIA
jgi:hypothetical protein